MKNNQTELKEHFRTYEKIVDNEFMIEDFSEMESVNYVYNAFPNDVDILVGVSCIYFFMPIIINDSFNPHNIESLRQSYNKMMEYKGILNNYISALPFAQDALNIINSEKLMFHNSKKKAVLEWLYYINYSTALSLNSEYFEDNVKKIVNKAASCLDELILLKPGKSLYYADKYLLYSIFGMESEAEEFLSVLKETSRRIYSKVMKINS